MKPAKILIVEDEKDVKDLMEVHLKREGHEVHWCDNGESAKALLRENKYDLGIFDWMLPGVSGLELCREFRGRLPILMVTARADITDVVLGLEMGADDYVTKPFPVPLFTARVRALLRRSRMQTQSHKPAVFEIGGLRLDLERHHVSCDGKQVELTASEFKLLAAFMENAGKVMSRAKLIEVVQGEGITVTDRVVDTHVFGLRKKLGAFSDFIETIRGVGYRIKVE
jgi:two-component system phosphate regulon response regulator PhoB